MSALSVIQATLVNFAPTLLTNTTGGTSQGNPSAGTSLQDSADPLAVLPPTNADRAGAGILTALLLVCTVAGVGFMVTGS
jgi:mannan endo-1,6-alpha-mannosidase